MYETDPNCRLASEFPGWHICRRPDSTPIAEGEPCAVNATLSITDDVLADALMTDPFVGPRGVRG